MPLKPQLLSALESFLGDRVSTAAAVCNHHAKGEDYYSPAPPDAVCTPRTTEEVATIARLCTEHRTPIVPFGAGTSMEGHVLASRGGICVDVSHMNRILEVNDEDLDCRVEAGVTRKQLEKQVRNWGLFFPIDPGADASLGGMAATSASGTTTVRYGTMKENVLGLTVVLADGRIIRTGSRARKSSAGYDLTRLFIGSEGTLGLFTELQLRLYGIPEAISAAVCQYPDIESAVQTVITTVQLGIPVARIELLDDVQMGACIRYSDLQDFSKLPTLFFEFHGSPTSVADDASQVKKLSDELGGTDFHWASRTEERSKLWHARHNSYYACLAMAPGKSGLTTDACVPISRLAECILETRQDIEENGLQAPMAAHAGDGNFHLMILFHPDDPDEVARAHAANHRLLERALAMGGTCTGEHGIGIGKRDALVAEHPEGVEVMAAIKRALDPLGIMNPDKVLLPQGGRAREQGPGLG